MGVNLYRIGQGLAAFGSGAAAGVLSLYWWTGWAVGGAILGGTSSLITGVFPIRRTLTGAVTGLVAGQLG